MNSNYTLTLQFYAGMPTFGMERSHSNQSKGSKTGKRQAEWTTENTDFLLQLWADNYEFINSSHLRKAWKKIQEKLNSNFPENPQKVEQIKRKINYHGTNIKMFLIGTEINLGAIKPSPDSVGYIEGYRIIARIEMAMGEG